MGRKTLTEISQNLHVSVPTLRKRFDTLVFDDEPKQAPERPINLIIDATFFGRAYGFLCFSDGEKIVYAREIKTESVAELETGLAVLQAAGYRFKSFTLDGKAGFIRCLKRLFPSTPVQMCHRCARIFAKKHAPSMFFLTLDHMQAIIRRYNTQNPKSDCGKDLKILMHSLGKIEPQSWIDAFEKWKKKHHEFLSETNDTGRHIHRRLRSARRSINRFLPHLFLYKELPTLGIPNTTNALEGRFAHLKEKIHIHRGLKTHRKIKAIKFLLIHQ